MAWVKASVRRTGEMVALLAVLSAMGLPAWAEWHMSGYLGGAHTQNTFLRISQPAQRTNLRFSDVDYAGESFEFPLYYGVRGGYFFSRRIGLEAEFVHLKVFAQVNRVLPVEGELEGMAVSGLIPMSSIVSRFSISHGVNLLLGNVTLRQGFFRRPGDKLGRLLLLGRFGVGGTIPHPESVVLGMGDQHYEGGSPAIQLSGGLEVRLWRGLYWLSEYK